MMQETVVQRSYLPRRSDDSYFSIVLSDDRVIVSQTTVSMNTLGERRFTQCEIPHLSEKATKIRSTDDDVYSYVKNATEPLGGFDFRDGTAKVMKNSSANGLSIVSSTKKITVQYGFYGHHLDKKRKIRADKIKSSRTKETRMEFLLNNNVLKCSVVVKSEIIFDETPKSKEEKVEFTTLLMRPSEYIYNDVYQISLDHDIFVVTIDDEIVEKLGVYLNQMVNLEEISVNYGCFEYACSKILHNFSRLNSFMNRSISVDVLTADDTTKLSCGVYNCGRYLPDTITPEVWPHQGFPDPMITTEPSLEGLIDRITENSVSLVFDIVEIVEENKKKKSVCRKMARMARRHPELLADDLEEMREKMEEKIRYRVMLRQKQLRKAINENSGLPKYETNPE